MKPLNVLSIIGRRIAVTLCLCLSPALHAQTPVWVGSSSYDNLVFLPAPNSSAIPATNAQAPAVAIFGGSVYSDEPIAAGSPDRLIQSSFGQPVQSSALLIAKIGVGGELIPDDPGLLGVAPDNISPSTAVFYLASEHKLIATEPGIVTLTWGTTNREFLISGTPAQTPVALYWSRTSTGGVGGPPVQIPNGLGAQFLWNSTVLPGSVVVNNRQLVPNIGALGTVVLIYTNSANGAYFGREVVELRDPDPRLSQHLVTSIGNFLAPAVAADKPGPIDCRTGLTNPDPVYLSQLSRPGDVVDGRLFAFRPTSGPGQINVIWTRQGVGGVVWPYEMDSYDAVWPADFSTRAMRLYLTEDGNRNPTSAPFVDLGSIPSITIHYNDEIKLGANLGGISTNLWLAGKFLHAAVPGRILLHYENQAGLKTNGFLGFQLVDVVPNNPDFVTTDAPIGTALTPVASYDIPILPGKVTRGTQTPSDSPTFAYVHNVKGPMNGLIYPVRPSNPGDIEVFWMRNGVQGIAWPYEMHWYGALWPEKAQLFVRGHTPDALGTPVFIPDRLHAQITFQEPPNTAALTNGTVLNASGEAYLLLKYTTGNPQGANLQFQVVHSLLHDSQVPAVTNWDVGAEITDPYHQISTTDPLNAKPGYVHVASDVRPLEDRFAFNVYTTTGQIFGVNQGPLEVWWMNLDTNGIQWPSLVKRYDLQWPASTDTIVIASGQGTGPINPSVYPDFQLYFQNDPAQPGFNPNDEHATVQNAGSGPAIFPLRNDLGRPTTSLPFVLMHHAQPGRLARRAFKLWNVVAEDATHKFQSVAVAGQKLSPTFPLGLFQAGCPQQGVSGPFWPDRLGSFWSKAAGDDGGGTNIVMHWFYQPIASFFLPTGISRSTCLPWLDGYAGTPGVPVNATTTVYWPDAIPAALSGVLSSSDIPSLHVGETLLNARNGLPDIVGQCSVEVLYQQSLATGTNRSVEIIDPTRKRSVPLAKVPGTVETESIGGRLYFKKLPPLLRSRLYFDPSASQLVFQGLSIPTISDAYLLPNIITAREAQFLTSPSFTTADTGFVTAIRALIAKAGGPVVASVNDPLIDSVALSAGIGRGTGYVTVAMGSSTNRCQASSPVSLSVLKVECPIHSGNLEMVTPSSPFEEKVTMRFDGELAGHSENYVFDWRYLPDQNGLQPVLPESSGDPGWIPYSPVPSTGVGALDVTVEGSGLLTLSDNWFTCRYRSIDPGSPCGTNEWSDWTPPQLQEGWIKRVVQGINPFDQRFQDLGDPGRTVNTTVNMLSQAGHRWEGAIPLDPAKIDNYGLIEIYETVFKEGIHLSIGANPPVAYGPIDNQLLLVAGKLSDLYMLLGNEAFADASDPTISVGASPSSAYVAAEPSIFSFMGEVPDLLHEQLALLRGQDNQKAPGVQVAPVYNRLYWNFSGGVGETAYVLKHNINDNLGNKDGFINVQDALDLYPQGHGDAWGHYLTASTYFYQLFRNTNFTWTPRSEATLIGGVPVTVNYVNERKFAQAAAAKARTGAEIVNLTYRASYDENPANQWQGYKDNLVLPKSTGVSTSEPRAWGLEEWGSRVGQAALFDWIVGNALLPDNDTSSHDFLVQKVDRTTVAELSELGGSLESIQAEVDKANTGVNPIGLAKNVMPFDIDPSQLTETGGQTHFEQVYDRAVTIVNNALTVFNYANNATQQLRQQADDETQFNKAVANQTADFNNRLIEIFGTPYPDDIGNSGQTYPAGYIGPDLQHYDYVDPSSLLGVPTGGSEIFTVRFFDTSVNTDGSISTNPVPVTFNVSSDGFGMVKPATWTSSRQSPGQLQADRSEILQARFRFIQALDNYDNTIAQIQLSAQQLEAQYNLHTTEINLITSNNAAQVNLDNKIKSDTQAQIGFQTAARLVDEITAGAITAIPTSMIFGTAGGGDLLAPVRGALQIAGSAISEGFQAGASVEQVNILSAEQQKQQLDAENNLNLTTARNDFDAITALGNLQQLVRQEVPQRVEVQTLQETLQQSIAKYRATLASGYRLLQDFKRFQQQTAAQVQSTRYKDMAFRIFRNDALQKYQAQFDLAARYVYLAARAYDFETNFEPNDPRSPRNLMNQIMRSRAIGLIQDGQPQTGGSTGDPGLTDAMARMINNWAILKGQLGFNNPQREDTQFSLRRELFRIPAAGATNDALWKAVLTRSVVTNLYALPEFQRLARFVGGKTEAGIVIPFTGNITPGLNFFGWPLGGGDHSYDPSHFATKIRSVGVWFDGYNNLTLANTPRVFLIPIGNDVMRSPVGTGSTTRLWKILEQTIPVPFPLGNTVPSDSAWTPINDSLSGSFVDIRQYAPFRAYHDAGYNLNQITFDSRLIGRSVWNTQWWLVIPAQYLFSDENEGLQRFIHGNLVKGVRDGQGIKDIQILFQTYSYQGQ